MAKRITIKHLRKLVRDANGLPNNRDPHVHINLRVLPEGYVLSFAHEDLWTDETDIMSCKECYCYLLGIFRTAREIASDTGETEALKIMQAQQDRLLATIRNYEARINANAAALHKLYLEKEAAEKGHAACINANREIRSLISQLNCKTAGLAHTS